MMTDPIADMLTSIRNAQRAKKRVIEVPSSKLKENLVAILLAQGYLEAVEKQDETHAKLVITLKYDGKTPVISSLKRESTPGHRKYVKAEDMPRVLNDFGIAIVSTSQGLMTNKDARQKGIGGEVICSIF
jgi:small subunit ribosomal protein S8